MESAAIDSIRSLILPTPAGQWFSIGLSARGNTYGIEEDLIFSFPCRSKGNAQVEIVANIPWDPFLKEKIALTHKELLEEKAMVATLLKG